MRYRLQLPRREPVPTADIVVTPEVRERRQAAMGAFTEQLRRLASLFPNGLEGLDGSSPDVWAEIKAAETKVDHVALRYIEGRESKASFDRALRAYEQAWRRGAETLASGGCG
jgi:hypothetical protein